MMSRKLVFFILLLLSSCSKEELVTVGNNTPPPDPTLEAVTIENYINRTYILALGREPDETELTTAQQSLLAAGVDSTSRQDFLESVFSDASYLPTLYNQNRIDLLNNSDTSDFSNWITVFSIYLQDTSFQFQWPYLQFEIDRLTALRDAFPLFISGTITVDELQRRMCNNYVYDQINMGSANFVISTFQHLINRNPTAAEQQSGISMVDGNNAVLFLQAGLSKTDYLNILTHCNSYFEAQVILLYKKYLNRIPSAYEMSTGTLKYASTGDYTAVQRDILSSNEFIGIQ